MPSGLVKILIDKGSVYVRNFEWISVSVWDVGFTLVPFKPSSNKEEIINPIFILLRTAYFKLW